MVRLLAAILCCSVSDAVPAALELAPGHAISGGVDAGFVAVSGYPSSTADAVGKLRYAEDGAGVQRAFVDYSGRWTDTLHAHVVAEAYDDDLGRAVDLTQAFLEWRPIPVSATRYRLKLGAFYPRMSLENVAAAWSSAYTLSSSAINTWIAEELRLFGAELSVGFRPASLAGAHAFAVDLAAFWKNDPAGASLAWQGWSVHERQARFSDRWPLPPLPQMQPGMMFAAQDPFVAPFRELDGRAGVHAGSEWRHGDRMLLRGGHYDNRAEPTVIENGQYAWHTKFTHLGLQATPAGDFRFVAQWMSGSTVMGPAMYANGAHAVDAEFASYFGLLATEFGRHRLAFRYDNFDVTQNDQTVADNNQEAGHALTLSYQLGLGEKLSLAAEGLRVRTHRCAWAYYGLEPSRSETQLQLSLRLRL